MYDLMFGIFETSLIMTGAIALLSLCTKLLRNKIGAAKRHLIWLLVATALLVPFWPFDTPVSASSGVAQGEIADIEYAPGVADGALNPLELWSRFRSDPSAGRQIASGAVDIRTAATGTGPVMDYAAVGELAGMHRDLSVRIDWATLIHPGLFVLWAGGALVFIRTWTARHRRFMRTVKGLWTEVDDPAALGQLEQIRHHLRIRRQIRFMSCPNIPTPVMVGVSRPTIILPEHVIAGDSEQLRLMLLHEALHCKRGDLFSRMLCLLALSAHWFNPAVHWMTRKAMEEAEQATDDAVLRHMGTDCRFQYGAMLLSIAKTGRSLRIGTVFVHGLTGEGKRLKSRLENIVNHTRISRWMVVSCTVLLLSVALAFSVAGLGGGVSPGEAESDPEYIEQIVNPDRSLFYGETITIAARDSWLIRPFAFMYMQANPGVRVEITQHLDLDWSHRDITDWGQARMEVGTQLMAGSAATLIHSYLVDAFDPRQGVFFYDWYKLMDADPNFHEEDWFMNVFHAFAIDGRLIHFPISVQYAPIVANRSIPELMEAMAEYAEGITLMELLQLHRNFSERYPQYHLEQLFTSEWIMLLNSEQFIDAQAGRVEFGEEFVNFITYADSITCPDLTDVWGGALGWPVTDSPREQVKSERYFFHLDSNQWFWYWLDLEEDIHLFAGLTPLTNDSGELLIMSMDNFLLNANATPMEKAIAWDFLMFMMQPENFPNDTHSWYLQPPNRNLFHYLIRQSMFFSWDHPRPGARVFPWFPGDTHYEAAEVVRAKMTPFAEMPMRSMSTHPRIIDEIIADNLRLFYEGLLSAEQTAQNIQNQITIVLMEMAR